MQHTVNTTKNESGLQTTPSSYLNFLKPFLDSITQTTLSVTFENDVAELLFLIPVNCSLPFSSDFEQSQLLILWNPRQPFLFW